MLVNLMGFSLDPKGAGTLKSYVSAHQSSVSADALVDHVLSLGAGYAVIEEPYVDKDYSADYLNFYAAAFRNYPRHTKRIHLFAKSVEPALRLPMAEQQTALEEAGYLGFVVVRPIAQGPIGRTILKFPSLGPDLLVRSTVRATFNVHLLGSRLELTGAAPFIQQDERLGSCAQASIWMAARQVHERHGRTPWHSIADITALATTPTDADLSQHLPAGSGGLNPIHIIRALRAMGHQPLFDFFLTESESGSEDAVEVRREAGRSIVRYLDSGLPVIVALADVGEKVGHAITAVGYVEARGAACRASHGYDAFVRAIVVHDDQRGPYRLMPLTHDDVGSLPKDRLLIYSDKPLTVEDAASHIFVPLPSRVFLRADRADTVVRDFLESYVEQVGGAMLLRIDGVVPDAALAVKDFYALVTSGRLIRRTYLTTAGRYRHHLARADLAEEIKTELLVRRLPHFVWVTELISPDCPPPEGDDARNIIGHMVVNATSSADSDFDLLMAHMPHVLVHRDINVEIGADPPFKETALIFEMHAPYRGRKRLD
ncbi:MAG: hypothetical protein H6870_15320 [Methylobacteriaceae bacterium]|nr:hypothetical protein [Methylobacteriaceae bacterium]